MPRDRMPRARIHEPTTQELRRLDDLLCQVSGPNVSWDAQSRLEVWMAETKLDAERLAARNLLIATWVLASATVGLLLATVGLIVVAN